MQKSITKKLVLHSFWFSVLLHLLLLLSFSTILVFSPPEEKKKLPNLYVPSYTYTGKINTADTQQQRSPKTQKTQQAQKSTEQKNIPAKKDGILPKSILASTQEVLQASQQSAIRSSFSDAAPIYLVGDDNVVSDPLIKLMGRALSVHFSYPRMAGEFGIRGRALVGLTLHPDGHFSDVQVLSSSNNEDLDSAALYAVNRAPKVAGADRFISEPKHFVVGFIFN
jgi:TonB family protein